MRGKEARAAKLLRQGGAKRGEDDPMHGGEARSRTAKRNGAQRYWVRAARLLLDKTATAVTLLKIDFRKSRKPGHLGTATAANTDCARPLSFSCVQAIRLRYH